MLNQKDFLDQDFYSLTENKDDYENNFQESFSCASRNLILKDSISYLIHVKNKMIQNKQKNPPSQLQTSQLKNVKFDYSSEHLGKSMARQLEKVSASMKEGQQLNHSHLFTILYHSLKKQLTSIVIFYCIQAVLRVVISLQIILLLKALSRSEHQNAYIIVAFLGLTWYMDQLVKHLGSKQSGLLSSKIKSGILTLLYAKISNLSSYTIKSSQLGKLINLLASDMSVIEHRFGTLMQVVSFPISIVGITTLLIIQVGWAGVTGIITILLTVPIANYISKRNGTIIQDINIYKDKRMKMTTQIIEGIKFIKLYGWQIAFRRIIQRLRHEEIINLKRLAFGRSIERALSLSIGFISGLAIFIFAHYFNQNKIGIIDIFTSLEMVSSFKIIILNLGQGLGIYYEVKIILDRFSNVLNINNIAMKKINQQTKEVIVDYDNLQRLKNQYSNSQINLDVFCDQLPETLTSKRSEQIILQKGEIVFKNFNGYWKKDRKQASLKNINLRFKKGIFYGITGRVGSGKSGLLGVILRQIPYYSGLFWSNGSISYVEQEPSIFSLSIKQNILFGKQFLPELYNQVLEDSCMKSDLEIMINGDETIVGQKGITLSGGQKARLSLARALYAQSQILLFDDPISALDSKVARKIHENCLRRISKVKTVILVTHQISFLHDCDEVIILKDGQVTSKGHPRQLEKQLLQLSEQTQIEEEQQQNIIENQYQQKQVKEYVKLIKQYLEGNRNSAKSQNDENHTNIYIEKSVQVSFKSYANYLKANSANCYIFPFVVLLFLLSQAITTVYLRFLASYNKVSNGSDNNFQNNFPLYWGILALLVLLYFFALIAKYYLLNLCILNSNQTIHENMIMGIVRSPGYFFDQTPSGVLVNKFSNDLGILDNTLSQTFVDVLEGPFSALFALINVCIIYVYFVPPFIVFLIISILLFFYAKQVMITCKQKDLKNKSPVFNLYSETITGLIQIKILNKRRKMMEDLSKIVNNCVKASVSFDMVTRGFAFLTTALAQCLLIIGLMIGIGNVNNENFGLYGVVVIFLISFSQRFQWSLRQIISTQSLMISSERAFQVVNLQSEKQLRANYDNEIGLQQEIQAAKQEKDLHTNWPKNSSIQFVNFSARYQPHLPLVLKNISFTVKANSKIGIVGRTGSGKSSIIQAIFRIIEPEFGSEFKIDSYDALKMGLHSLRHHISVIPQTPFLFKGTVRENIDPFQSSSQEQIWKVLEESQLANHVKSLPKQLQTDISNSSESFSVGQKQLLCLARALLRKNNILILDEATSNVDMKTDDFIQSVLKNKFKDTTIITIAHRLSTIADYDEIIVMQRGRIVQMSSPYELILQKGMFYEMVINTGKNADLIINKAKKSYLRKSKQVIHIKECSI